MVVHNLRSAINPRVAPHGHTVPLIKQRTCDTEPAGVGQLPDKRHGHAKALPAGPRWAFHIVSRSGKNFFRNPRRTVDSAPLGAFASQLGRPPSRTTSDDRHEVEHNVANIRRYARRIVKYVYLAHLVCAPCSAGQGVSTRQSLLLCIYRASL